MRVGVALLLCLVAAPAAADPVNTGAPRRVYREREGPFSIMLFVEPTRGGTPDVSLIGVVGELVPGDEYDVLDEGGYAAHVRVAGVERTDHRCPGFYYQRARARILESHHEIDAGRAVAVGPALMPRRAAQLLFWSEGEGGLQLEALPGGSAVSKRPIAQAPPPGVGPTLIQLVDLDGDRIPELARYLYQCTLGSSQAWSGQGTACFEDWVRAARGWHTTAHVEFSCD